MKVSLVVVSLTLLMVPLTAAQASWRDAFRQAFGQAAQSPQADALLETEIVAGLREALAQGTTRAVNQLGRSDGFWANAAARIPLPAPLARGESGLRRVGLGASVDQFHLTLNRAAEQAVPHAADLLGEAIRQMSVADARTILQGQSDAATRYFERVSGPQLRARFLPIVNQTTAQVGVTQQYKSITASAGPLLQIAGAGAAVDLDGYIADRALSGLFALMADEEKRIRDNPAARGSEVLKRVFGQR